MTSSPLIKPERQDEKCAFHRWTAFPGVGFCRPGLRLNDWTLFAAETRLCRALATVVSERSAKIWRAIVRPAEHNGESRRIGIRETESELSRPPRAHVGRNRLYNVG